MAADGASLPAIRSVGGMLACLRRRFTISEDDRLSADHLEADRKRLGGK